MQRYSYNCGSCRKNEGEWEKEYKRHWQNELQQCIRASIGIQYLHEPIQEQDVKDMHKWLNSLDIPQINRYKPQINNFQAGKGTPIRMETQIQAELREREYKYTPESDGSYVYKTPEDQQSYESLHSSSQEQTQINFSVSQDCKTMNNFRICTTNPRLRKLFDAISPIPNDENLITELSDMDFSESTRTTETRTERLHTEQSRCDVENLTTSSSFPSTISINHSLTNVQEQIRHDLESVTSSSFPSTISINHSVKHTQTNLSNTYTTPQDQCKNSMSSQSTCYLKSAIPSARAKDLSQRQNRPDYTTDVEEVAKKLCFDDCDSDEDEDDGDQWDNSDKCSEKSSYINATNKKEPEDEESIVQSIVYSGKVFSPSYSTIGVAKKEVVIQMAHRENRPYDMKMTNDKYTDIPMEIAEEDACNDVLTQENNSQNASIEINNPFTSQASLSSTKRLSSEKIYSNNNILDYYSGQSKFKKNLVYQVEKAPQTVKLPLMLSKISRSQRKHRKQQGNHQLISPIFCSPKLHVDSKQSLYKVVSWMTAREVRQQSYYQNISKSIEISPPCDRTSSILLSADQIASIAKRVCGGIIADDLQFDISLCCLKLICKTLAQSRAECHQERVQAGLSISLIKPPTLIITSRLLLQEWKNKIQQHTNLRFLTYNGVERKAIKTPMELMGMDIVLSTYDALRLNDFKTAPQTSRKSKRSLPNPKSWKQLDTSMLENSKIAIGSKLHQVQWYRVILDQCHLMTKRNSSGSNVCLQLRSKRKWCLTYSHYTMDNNNLTYLARFLGVPSFLDNNELSNIVPHVIYKTQSKDNKQYR